MGWKTIKEHYKIGHIVQITPKGICIGSPYIHDIIVIGLDGKVIRPYRDKSNHDLMRYQELFDSDPEELKSMVLSEDKFTKSLPVFTYSGGDIIEKECEEYGWPNVTHDGCIMYENTFSKDRDKVIELAKGNAKASIRILSGTIKEKENRLSELRAMLKQAELDLLKLAN